MDAAGHGHTTRLSVMRSNRAADTSQGSLGCDELHEVGVTPAGPLDLSPCGSLGGVAPETLSAADIHAFRDLLARVRSAPQMRAMADAMLVAATRAKPAMTHLLYHLLSAGEPTKFTLMRTRRI